VRTQADVSQRRYSRGVEPVVGSVHALPGGAGRWDILGGHTEGFALQVRSEVVDGVAVFRIAGRFDAQAVTDETLQSGVGAAVSAGTPRIIFDMRGVSFITSAGVRVVVMTAKRRGGQRRSFALRGPTCRQ